MKNEKSEIKKILISELSIKVKCVFFYCLPELKPFVQFKMIKFIYVRSYPCRSLLVEYFLLVVIFSLTNQNIIHLVINGNITIIFEPRGQE